MKTLIGKGIVGQADLTHGTLESRNLEVARGFYEQGLGLRCVRHSPPSQLLAGAGDVSVVCVNIAGGIHEQGSENRWVVLVPDSARVTEIHRAVTSNATQWGVLSVEDVTQLNGETSFVIRDADSNWWQVTDRPVDYYQKIFERGEAV